MPDPRHQALAEALAAHEEAAREEGRPADPGAAEALQRERQRVLTGYERGLRGLEEAEARVREIDARLELLRAQADPRPAEADPEALAVELAAPFAEWSFLGTAEKRRILGAAVEAVEIERAGRLQARVVAVRLRVPTPEPPVPPIDPRRAMWSAWGDVVRVAL